MNQFSTQGVNEQVARGGTSDDDANFVKDQPFDGGDEFGFDRGQIGSDPDWRLGGIGWPWEEEDGGSVGEEDRVIIDGGEKVRVVYHPTGFSGSDFTQFFARYAS